MSEYDKLRQLIKNTSVPYKVENKLADSGELLVGSPGRSSAMLTQSSPDLVEDGISQSFFPKNLIDKTGDNPMYLNSLESDPGFGAKTLKQAEFEAQKRGADSLYLTSDASYGRHNPEFYPKRKTQPELNSFYKEMGYEQLDNSDYPIFSKSLSKDNVLNMDVNSRSNRAIDQGFTDITSDNLLKNSKTGEIRDPSALFDPNNIGTNKKFGLTNSIEPKVPGIMDTLKQAGGDISGIASKLYKDSALEKADNYRAQALDKIMNATDITQNVPEADTSSAKEYGRMGLDLIAPDVTDLIPMGKLSKGLKLGVKEAKALKRGEKSAEEMAQTVRKAQLEDLNSSSLVGKPVYATAEEKALTGGKVITPDMPNVSDKEIRKFLEENSPSFKEHLQDRNLFKTNPEAYSQKKDFYFKKAREYLTNKKLEGK